MDKPFFSIVIATHNRASFLVKAIRSVLSQDLSDLELVIVDDGSTDDTTEIVSSLKDHHIRYFKSEPSGRSAARNFGLKQTKGEYVCFLDDDDFYYPDFLSKMYSFIQKNGSQEAIYLCDQDQYDESGNPLSRRVAFPWNDQDALEFLIRSVNNLQPACISRKILERFQFDERFEIGEDFHLLLRIGLHYPVFYLDLPLVGYLNHPGSTMDRELSEELYETQKFNRVDVFEDLWESYKDSIMVQGGYEAFFKKANKIRYFYASNQLKRGHLKKALLYVKGIRLVDFRALYSLFSIYLRIPVYFFRIILSGK